MFTDCLIIGVFFKQSSFHPFFFFTFPHRFRVHHVAFPPPNVSSPSGHSIVRPGQWLQMMRTASLNPSRLPDSRMHRAQRRRINTWFRKWPISHGWDSVYVSASDLLCFGIDWLGARILTRSEKLCSSKVCCKKTYWMRVNYLSEFWLVG